MQKRSFPFILIFFTVLTIKIQALPSCYYTYDQISQLLSTYESQYPDIAKKVLIGYSQEDHIPSMLCASQIMLIRMKKSQPCFL